MKLDAYEQEILDAFEAGKLNYSATKSELDLMRAAARATAIKDQRINIRLSTGDLRDIQTKAFPPAVPWFGGREGRQSRVEYLFFDP